MVRRARIPTQKVIEAQESMNRMNTQQIRKGNQGKHGVAGSQKGVSPTLVTLGGEKSMMKDMHVVDAVAEKTKDDSPLQLETTIVGESNETVQEEVNGTVKGQENAKSPKSVLKEWNDVVSSANRSVRKS